MMGDQPKRQSALPIEEHFAHAMELRSFRELIEVRATAHEEVAAAGCTDDPNVQPLPGSPRQGHLLDDRCRASTRTTAPVYARSRGGDSARAVSRPDRRVEGATGRGEGEDRMSNDDRARAIEAFHRS